MVVLWERNDDTTNLENWTWLAYHVLPEDSYIGPRIYFQDNMEDTAESDLKWDDYGGEWDITATDSHSGDQSWDNDPFSGGCGTDYNRLASVDFSLLDATSPSLSFWHHYSITGSTDGGLQISTDGGNNWQDLEAYNGNENRWTREIIDLSDYAGEEQVRIRFALDIGNQTPDWNIDDVKVYEGEGLNWPTLLVSVKEAESISFNNGSSSINSGDTVYQEDAGGSGTASATVYTDPVIDQGSWSGGNAQGDILLRDISGTFQTGQDLLVNGEVCANLTSLNNKQNYIRAYIGDQQEHGTAGTDPLDRQRLANPRGGVNWQPRDVDDTYDGNDYYTLVQWDEVNGDLDPTSISQMGTGNEEDAVIRTNRVTGTSPAGSFPETRPELGLHTWGWGSSDGEPDQGEVPNIYFDDFAVRLDDVVTSGGFAPAIQESAAGQ
ncbi:MAG: hypothetical protein K9J85_00025 [Desulfobacteraceae bacterium]|nr:hypothetical protein [Desulfobacteraceae bacterium]